jgi:hypothetical protein
MGERNLTCTPCPCCETLAAECLVPDGEGGAGAVKLCWLCAHMVTEHEIPRAELRQRLMSPETHTVWCACTRTEIYPGWRIEELDRAHATALHSAGVHATGRKTAEREQAKPHRVNRVVAGRH